MLALYFSLFDDCIAVLLTCTKMYMNTYSFSQILHTTLNHVLFNPYHQILHSFSKYIKYVYYLYNDYNCYKFNYTSNTILPLLFININRLPMYEIRNATSFPYFYLLFTDIVIFYTLFPHFSQRLWITCFINLPINYE